MKGLTRIPSHSELALAYADLQQLAKSHSAADLALWSQWSRFDPRLAEQLTACFGRCWKEINPVRFREELALQPWPTAPGPLLEQALEQWIAPNERSLFRRWMELALNGFRKAVKPGSQGQFFVGQRALAGKLMLEDAASPLRGYLRWGFLGRELLINKARATMTERTRLSKDARRRRLDELIGERSRITVGDYRQALQEMVSPRQAELDLARHPRLVAMGNTRARFYRVRGRAK